MISNSWLYFPFDRVQFALKITESDWEQFLSNRTGKVHLPTLKEKKTGKGPGKVFNDLPHAMACKSTLKPETEYRLYKRYVKGVSARKGSVRDRCPRLSG